MSRLSQHATKKTRSRVPETAGRTGSRSESPDTGSGRLPSRRMKHPSNKQQTTKFFYQALLLLFVFLAAGLFMFGKKLGGQ